MIRIIFPILGVCFLFSCNNDRIEITNEGIVPKISLINHTGHDDRHCSKGVPLSFVIRHEGLVDQSNVDADSFGSYVNADLEEGDVLTIQILDKNGTVILSRTKNYNPSNPENEGASIGGGPYIRVCLLDKLEINDF